MSTITSPALKRPGKPGMRVILACAAAVVLVAAMAFDTKVVRIGSPSDVQPGVFSPAAFGTSEFPKVQSVVSDRAVDASTLAAALAKDSSAAVQQYGTPGVAGAGPVFPVKFTGVAGSSDLGVYDVKVDGVPDNVKIRVQTGPAIMGTDLRDVTGTVHFGQFTNQIEYQNAGAALNKELKKKVLSKIDAGDLSGKTLDVVGAFQMSDPNNWVVTPIKLQVH